MSKFIKMIDIFPSLKWDFISNKTENAGIAEIWAPIRLQTMTNPGYRSVDLETKLSNRNFSPQKNPNEFVFLPDNSELFETWISISNLKYFWVIRIEKHIGPFVFLGEVMARQFWFEIYWPLEREFIMVKIN